MVFLDLRKRPKTLRNPRKYYVEWNGGTRSKGQTALKKFLYPFWKNDLILEEMPLVGSRMTFDIVNISKSICIEFQGKQHTEHVKHFHGARTGKFLSQIKRDMKKHDWCEINGFNLVEIFNEKELTYEYFSSKGILL